METTKQKVSKKVEGSTVAYLDLNLMKNVSTETKEKILEGLNSLKYKVYTSDNATDLLRYKKPTIYRFGVFPTGIESKLLIRGAKIISGDY